MGWALSRNFKGFTICFRGPLGKNGPNGACPSKGFSNNLPAAPKPLRRGNSLPQPFRPNGLPRFPGPGPSPNHPGPFLFSPRNRHILLLKFPPPLSRKDPAPFVRPPVPGPGGPVGLPVGPDWRCGYSGPTGSLSFHNPCPGFAEGPCPFARFPPREPGARVPPGPGKARFEGNTFGLPCRSLPAVSGCPQKPLP